jgi:hypothetical protein
MVFAVGTAKNGSSSSTQFVGWYQVDESTGRVINEGFISGEPDFLWGIHEARLNWHASSTYIGSAMRSEFRIGLIVNAIPDLRNQTEEGDRIAQSLNLPSNWKSYIVTEAQIDAQLATEKAAEEQRQAEERARAEAEARAAAEAAQTEQANGGGEQQPTEVQPTEVQPTEVQPAPAAGTPADGTPPDGTPADGNTPE